MQALIGKLHANSGENLAAAVYAEMKRNIINWSLQPGTKMSESRIAQHFQVSRTPVREAFKQLVLEGLLEIQPQRGTYVTRVNLEQMRQGRFVRASLERALIPLLIETQALLLREAALRENISQQRACLEQNDFDGFFALDEAFHNSLFDACGQYYAKQIANRAHLDYLRVRIICMKRVSNPLLLCDQHQRVLEAILANDRERAEAELTAHLDKVKQDLELVRAHFPESFIQGE
ncbi:MAG: GntR family transcriptional regulator [Sporomusaceae bacterium]|nr:GntR family transcriptional regulator [Sporomusaceae bacterium]